MSVLALRAQIREDLAVHDGDWTRPGFRAIAAYRIGVWRMGVGPKWLRAPLTLFYNWAFRHCRNVYGIELPYTCTIGRRVRIEHQGGIVVHGATVIGDDCIIRQNCTLGIRRLDQLHDAPILEDGVNVGAGAVILGRVTIGTGAAIGANAVVLTDVPAGALATGVPATVRLRG
ncbi:serine acetyltransferase [Sphingomonas metalli]|uniref:Serine acetyltransferase n=1 Tax=Sphingomonas metalli TaxID=1779358 RepID=A0A916WVG5_9SPHN|nr:serine acetyltransferase [Sphingomonas metalli]GGB37182.1 serine acetyltransferase [Sphingomonas metalli]